MLEPSAPDGQGEARAVVGVRPFFLERRFFVFLAVGALNTAFGYGAFALLVLLGLHYAVAAFLSTVAGTLFNFQTTGRIVFNRSDPALVFRFLGVYGVTYVTNVGLLSLLRVQQGEVLYVQAFLVLPMAALAFWLQRRFVFEREASGS